MDEVPRGNREDECCGRSWKEEESIHHCHVAL